MSTLHEMHGVTLGKLASSNDEGSKANLETLREARLRQGGPIDLKTRDNRPVIEPPAPPKSSPAQQTGNQPSAQPSSSAQPQANPPVQTPQAPTPPQNQPQ